MKYVCMHVCMLIEFPETTTLESVYGQYWLVVFIYVLIN